MEGKTLSQNRYAALEKVGWDDVFSVSLKIILVKSDFWCVSWVDRFFGEEEVTL